MQQLPVHKPLIYLGCALSHAPEDFSKEIDYLRKELEPYGDVLHYLGLQHPSLGEVFQYDLNCVRRCDVMVANVTYPSLGLGVEFGTAVEHHKPIITIADDRHAVERIFMMGYYDPLHFTLRYKSKEEAARFVVDKILELFSQVS